MSCGVRSCDGYIPRFNSRASVRKLVSRKISIQQRQSSNATGRRIELEFTSSVSLSRISNSERKKEIQKIKREKNRNQRKNTNHPPPSSRTAIHKSPVVPRATLSGLRSSAQFPPPIITSSKRLQQHSLSLNVNVINLRITSCQARLTICALSNKINSKNKSQGVFEGNSSIHSHSMAFTDIHRHSFN